MIKYGLFLAIFDTMRGLELATKQRFIIRIQNPKPEPAPSQSKTNRTIALLARRSYPPPPSLLGNIDLSPLL
jgi:hypothetical protein